MVGSLHTWVDVSGTVGCTDSIHSHTLKMVSTYINPATDDKLRFLQMENSNSLVPASSPPVVAEPDSLFSSLLYDLSRQVESAMENMLKMTREVDQSSSEITEEIIKCNESGLSRKKLLEKERERVQKAVYEVLDMLQ